MSKTHLLIFHLTPKIGYKLNLERERETRQGDHPLTWWAAFYFNFQKLTGHIDLFFTFLGNDYRLDTYSLAGDFLVKKYGRYRPTMQSIWKIQNSFSKDAAHFREKKVSLRQNQGILFWDSYPTSAIVSDVTDSILLIEWSVCVRKTYIASGVNLFTGELLTSTLWLWIFEHAYW